LAHSYIDRLREILAQKPGSRIFLSLAEELKKLGHDDEAFKLLTDGTGKHPDFAAARLTLGRWYLQCNRYAEASRQFLAVLKNVPANCFARKGLAEANRMLIDSSGGVPPTASSGPEPPSAELAGADRLIAQGKYKRAMELCDEMLIDRPDDKRILQLKWELAALIKMQQRDLDRTVNKLNALLEAIKIHFGKGLASGAGM
jgi:tetratricopeptide (TPR) repeat protein